MKKIISGILLLNFVFISSMLFFGLNGRAYIDPSVVTYLIQIVSGVVISLGAFFGVYGRKLKKKITKKLGINEYRNKEVESDDIKIW